MGNRTRGPIRPVDVDRLLGPMEKPTGWRWELVGERMIEALDVVRRIPAKTYPATFKTIWPEYATEIADEVIQKLEGTFEIGRNVVIRTASSAEVERMEEALFWPWTYLHGNTGIWNIRGMLAWSARCRGRTEVVWNDARAPQDEFVTIMQGLIRDDIRVR